MPLWHGQGKYFPYTNIAIIYFSLENYIINIFLASLWGLLIPRLRIAVNRIPLCRKII
jgi:hypothetical protein